MRVALTLAYNGTHFLGSQTQTETTRTIFTQVERALCEVSITSKPVPSGRTDKGVHATGQVCHLDLPAFWSDLGRLKWVLNSKLPSSIKIKSIKQVSDDFHARYSAKKRSYRYILKNEKSNPFENDFVTFVEDLEFEKIEKNIGLFVGEFDFKQFMKTGSDVKTTQREVYRAFAYRHKGFIVLHFEATGFLRSQIRLMVGALLDLNAEQIQEQLLCTVKHKIKPAKCNGLYLSRIKY